PSRPCARRCDHRWAHGLERQPARQLMDTRQVAHDLLQRAIAAQVCSAAALAVATPHGDWHLALGRTARWRRDGHGQLQPWPGEPIDDSTVFDLASLTKPLCTLSLVLQDLSKDLAPYRLHDRLQQHLPAAQETALGQ